EPERIDTGAQQVVRSVRAPFEYSGRNGEPQRIERDLGIRRAEVQAGRYRAVVKRQGKLGKAGDARRGLQMPEVGFDRADPQRVVARSAASENAPQCGRLDRITHRRTGPVRFHIAYLRSADSGAAVDLVQQTHLLIEARD